MFQTVHLKHFKKFKDTSFALFPTGLSLLAGGNNSGKSTFLQAIAVWDFCVAVLQNERGTQATLPGYKGQGIGLADDEFSPILIPALNHLWTNLTNQVPGGDGYTLSVRPEWKNANGSVRHLEIRLALANDRLFIKPTSSNLSLGEQVPRVAFVPPFAGISAKEQKMSVAQRRAMVGSGLVGAIIRNILLDLETENLRKRQELKGERKKIKNSDLKTLRESDPWEILQAAMGKYFQTSLSVEPFNDLYHTYIRVKLVKGTWDKTRIKKFPKFKPRDMMAEGSGFLQWLSVFALALDPRVQVILLDEPDAHLHSSLQTLLVAELEEIGKKYSKQILLATHSTEILRWAEHTRILQFKNNKAKYLEVADDRIGLFAGLGSEFSPRLDRLKKLKAMLIVENESDFRLIRMMAKTCGYEIPDDIVVWPWTGSSKERRQLFFQLKADIPGLQAVSIRDRDDLSQNQVDPQTLHDTSESDATGQGFRLCVWQRRHIENYLLVPSCIARASGFDVQNVIDHFSQHHGIVVPDNHTASNVLAAIKDARGKEIIETSQNSIEKAFGIPKQAICDALEPDEISEDVKVLIGHIRAMLGS